jgi:hypothetical protein
MSTTVVITPAIAASAGAGAALVPLAAIVGTALWAAARAAAHDPACAELLERSREQLRRERLATIELRTTDLERLRRCGVEARFEARAIARDSVRLSAGDEPVWAARTESGIRLIGDEAALRRLLVANTTSRVVEFLRGRGLEVETRDVGRELVVVGRGSGRRAVEVAVGGTGEARVDLKNFAGKECEREVRDLAAALEGTITSFCPKPEYYGTAAVRAGSATRA